MKAWEVSLIIMLGLGTRNVRRGPFIMLIFLPNENEKVIEVQKSEEERSSKTGASNAAEHSSSNEHTK